MAYEELFTDLLKYEREEDVTDALTVFQAQPRHAMAVQ
jgi:hypothetical protein